jgi:signal transduction histidine kinase
VSGAHRDPEKNEVLRELIERAPPDWESPHPSAIVLRTGAPVLLAYISDAEMAAHSRGEAHLRIVRALGTRSAVAVPMVAHGRTVGVMTCASTTPYRYGEADVTVIQQLAYRAALAVDNASLFSRAQHAIRLREDFLSVAAHELTTPITSLKLMVEGMVSGAIPVSAESIQRTLGVADRQISRLAELIGELLDVSRIDAKRFAIHPEPMDLAEVVREVVGRLADERSRRGSSLSVSAEQPVVGVWDRMRLEQVVSNLLSNAIKFGAGKPIEVVTAAENGWAVLLVRDHGIGIPAEHLKRIFERFERAVSVQEYGGLGLGLYIVRSIVESLGGRVSVESTLGSGSTFRVDLPKGRER